ncbi:MAG: 2',3'-cyclic-nucleotide 2'-phosphodiesterase/3'-nucleotidase/5'-nucleotidase [Clostridium sp.]|jgi:2',3'-cyclic-nucleotide 2'-phosphodiesterase/3'-nucleotidase/5'-nucleotidase
MNGGVYLFTKFKGKKITAWLLTLMMILTFISPVNAFAEESGGEVEIQILATSDIHGKIMPFDYAQNVVSDGGSLVQVASAVKDLRASNPNTILIDAGDTIQGNTVDDVFNDADEHAIMTALNTMDYDAWTYGNHEFNFGVPTLEKISNQFNGTALNGNVSKKDGTPIAKAYTIKEIGGVKVGLIGMVSPNIKRWDAANLKEYTVTNPIVETKKAIAELKGKVDIMIGIMHMSETPEYGEAGSGADEIAAACPELTAIIAAHQHKATQKVYDNGVVLVENLNDGGTLAQINISLTYTDGKYVVSDKANDITKNIIYVKDPTTKEVVYQPEESLAAVLVPFDKMLKDNGAKVIGKLEGGDLVPAPEVKGISNAYVQDNAMTDLINEVQMYYSGAEISSAAALDGNANIKAGDIKKSDSALIYKYPNTLYLVKMTGIQLKKYMEWSASYFNTHKPGDLTVSFNPDIRGYNYDMLSGVKYDIDISKEPGKRIVNLKKLDGTQVLDTDTFKVAVNNYRYSSQLSKIGDVFSEGDSLPILLESDVNQGRPIREMIGDYIKDVKGGTITPDVDGNWKIIGNNWEFQARANAVKAISDGKLQLPMSADGRTPNIASVTYKDLVQATGEREVNILTFNDFHGAVEEGGKNAGIAKFAGEINRVKNINPNTIVVAAGDIFQGSAMSNLTYGAPVNEMMKEVGVVASAVGNHEFDWGIDKIAKWAEEGEYDFLASNIYDKTTGKPVTWAKPYMIVEKGGIKIGLVGIATPETAFKTSPVIVKNLEFKDPVASAKEWAKVAKDNGADVVIALTHLGAFQDDDDKITGEATDLCGVENIDAVISAHTHQTVSGMVNGIPVVQAYKEGRSLGRLTIKVDADDKVAGIVPSVDTLYKRADTLVEDATVKAIADKYSKELEPILGEILGATDKKLTHDKSAPGTSLLGQWTTDVMRKVAGTQIGITNGGGLRVPLAAGNITMGNMYEVMPFDNTLVTMKLKGSDLKRVIENGIGNAEIGWVQVGGVKVYYDEKAEFMDRISTMLLEDGTPVEMDKTYSVVTNDFMFSGGDKFDFTGAIDDVDTMLPIRDALVTELKAVKKLSVTNNNNLVSGTAPVTTTTPTAAGNVTNLPKTGSVVDTSVLVNLGVLMMLLGAGYIVVENDRKRRNEAA